MRITLFSKPKQNSKLNVYNFKKKEIIFIYNSFENRVAMSVTTDISAAVVVLKKQQLFFC